MVWLGFPAAGWKKTQVAGLPYNGTFFNSTRQKLPIHRDGFIQKDLLRDWLPNTHLLLGYPYISAMHIRLLGKGITQDRFKKSNTALVELCLKTNPVWGIKVHKIALFCLFFSFGKKIMKDCSQIVYENWEYTKRFF